MNLNLMSNIFTSIDWNLTYIFLAIAFVALIATIILSLFEKTTYCLFTCIATVLFFFFAVGFWQR